MSCTQILVGLCVYLTLWTAFCSWWILLPSKKSTLQENNNVSMQKLLNTQQWVCRSYLMRIMEYYGDGPAYFKLRSELEKVQALPKKAQTDAYIALLFDAYIDFIKEHYKIDGYASPEMVIQNVREDEDNIRSNIVVEITELLRTRVLLD